MQNPEIYLKIVAAFVIFSSLGPVLNKSSFSAIQSVFLMFSLASFWMLIVLILKKKMHELKEIKLNVPTLIFGVSSGLIPYFWLQSLALIPVATALFLLSSIPIVALFAEIFIFGQKAKPKGIVAILTGIIGILILLSDRLGNGREFLSIGSIFVLVGVICIVTQGFSIKKIGNRYSREMMVLGTVFTPALVSFLFAFQKPWHIDALSVVGVLFLSIFPALIAPYLYIQGLDKLKVSTVRLIGYIEVFLGSVWGVVFLAQPLLPVTFIGGSLILLASYLAITSGE